MVDSIPGEELMATPKHLKIVFRGIFNGTPEAWSFSTKFSKTVDTQPDATVDDINAGQVHDALDAYIGGSFFQSSVWCTEWRAYAIGTNGLTEGNPRLEVFDPADYVKGTSGSRLPTDISLCITTVAENRGPAKYGRFYIPGPLAILDTDHRISVANAETILANSVTFVKAISDSIDLPLSTGSSYMMNVSDVGGGHQQAVQKLQVGRVYDRIERRRRQMLEEYVVGTDIDW